MRIIQTADLRPGQTFDPDTTSWIYNGLDCAVTAEVYGALIPQLDDISRPIYEREKALQGPVLDMNMAGILVDQFELARFRGEMGDKLDALERATNRLLAEGYGISLEWNSPKQLDHLLYECLRLPPQYKRNAHGKMSRTVDRGALEKLSQHLIALPLISHILLMRDLKKKLSNLKSEISHDGIFRSSFNIAGTNTGRLSSSASDFGEGSNQQNIDRLLRRIYVARPGRKFANLDLGQADSRNVGALCWNRFLASHGEAFAGAYLDACESGDLHTTVTRMSRPHLAWPVDRDAWKKFADEPQAHLRGKSYRDTSKNWGHGCLTEDHEVLTLEGWVPIATQPDRIMTWTPNELTFAPVLSWTTFETDETIELTGTAYSLRATLDHRLPFNHNGKYRTETTSSLPTFGRIPLGSGYAGGGMRVPARLIAAVMSDGEVRANVTRFHFRKARKIARIRLLCDKYDVPHHTTEDGRITIRFTCAKQLDASCLTWDAQSVRDFVDEYSMWDGHQTETSTTVFSVALDHIEWLQTLGRLVGVGGNIQKPVTSGFGSTVYRLQQNRRGFASTAQLTRTMIKERVPVYCPTVASSWFLVRRNGRISVTGNSNYLLTPQMAAKKIPGATPKMAEDFRDAYYSAFPCIPEWHKAVAADLRSRGHLITLGGFRRYFFDRLDSAETLRAAVAFEGQGSTADEIITGMLTLWSNGAQWPGFQLLNQTHDSVLFEYDPVCENEIIPWALKQLEVPMTLEGGRPFLVPSDAKVGWNWGDYNDKPTDKAGKPRRLNLDGLRAWDPARGDDRVRQNEPGKTVQLTL